MKPFKKPLALLLTLLMLVSVFPFGVIAAGTTTQTAQENDSMAEDKSDYYYKYTFEVLLQPVRLLLRPFRVGLIRTRTL